MKKQHHTSPSDLETLDVPALAKLMHCSVGHVRRLLRDKKADMPLPRRAPGGHKIFFIALEVAEWLQQLPSADSPTRRHRAKNGVGAGT